MIDPKDGRITLALLTAMIAGGDVEAAGQLTDEPEGLFRFLVDSLLAIRTREHWEVWRGDRANGPEAPLVRFQRELNGVLLMIADRSKDAGALATHAHIFTEAELCEVCGFDRSA